MIWPLQTENVFAFMLHVHKVRGEGKAIVVRQCYYIIISDLRQADALPVDNCT